MSKEVDNKLIVLFQQMYEMTEPECRKCRVPQSCCDSMYCAMAAEYAQEDWGVDLTPLKTKHPTLPFMSETGCVVPPHLRPLCTLHTCDINNLACKPGDPEWTEKYFELREQINDLDYQRSEDKPTF